MTKVLESAVDWQGVEVHRLVPLCAKLHLYMLRLLRVGTIDAFWRFGGRPSDGATLASRLLKPVYTAPGEAGGGDGSVNSKGKKKTSIFTEKLSPVRFPFYSL